ncbi:MAG: glutamine synthetase [Gammaproteobacteria bacterium]|nr:glutamine synthetase [Gammaproteobacteria bacterium]
MPDTILQAIERLRRAEPRLRQVELLLPDLNGILRGKRCTLKELEGIARAGLSFPASGYLLDSRGCLIEGLVHGNADGDPDYLCRLVPGSLVPVPWSKTPLAQVLLGMEHRDGRPHFADSRQVLAGVLARFAALGLTPVVAVEYEFYLLDDTRGEGPRARQPRVPGTERRAGGPRVYSLEDLHELDDLFSAIASASEQQQIPAGSVVSEYGAGQYEVNLHHVADALLACDHAVLLRRLVRGVAARHGLAATFMAKPFADRDGSGMHVHLSLLDGDGRNVFGPLPAQEGAAYAPRLRHAVGGMLAALGESLAIFCPNANSYRRIRPGCFAPIAPNWGANHRGVAIRIPVSDAANLRLEHRPAGADCNPYLAVAAILAAVHHGITTQVEPPPMVREGEQIQADVTLAHRWESALDAFDRARVLPGYLGEEFCRVFSVARRFEADQFHAEVPNLDYDWYLPSI